MPIRFDGDKKELLVGVRDLASILVERDGSTSESTKQWGGYLPGRGMLGGDLHRVTQSEGSTTNPEYLREVFLRKIFEFQGYQVVVQGRLDALFQRNGEWIAQEIKTVALSPSTFQKLTEDNLCGFRHQLLIYLHLLESGSDCLITKSKRKTVALPCEPVTSAELLLVNIYDRKQKAFPIAVQEEDTGVQIQAGLEQILRNELEEYTRKQELKRLSRQIKFPHGKYRPYQKEMVEAVRKGLSQNKRVLLSAPPGSGKTAAALTPTLRHVFAEGIRLFIVTSKSTQQWLMWSSLRTFFEQGIPFRAVLIRAKEKLCLAPAMICHESVCAYCREIPIGESARDLFSRCWEHSMLDPETITPIAKEQSLCPFELTLALAYQADVIVGDYNYVFDPAVSLQRFQPEDWQDIVLLVDEIHNLYPRGRAMFSPELSRHLVHQCRQALIEQRTRGEIPIALSRNIGKWLSRLEKQFKELLQRGQLEYPDIPSHPVELDRKWWESLQQDLETLVVRYLLEMRVQELFPRENPLLEMFWVLSRFVKGFLLDENTYRIILDHNRPQRLKIHCLDPSGPIGSLLNRSPAMVGLSATLQPIEFFQTVLGLKTDDTEMLEFPSPFPSENRLLLVIGSVSTRYRYREQFTSAIGDIISRIVAIKKGNYLLFFPSYRFMRSVAQHVIAPEYLRIIQEPGLNEDQRVEMIESLQGDQPVLMFTVQGGIFSEGVDYPNQSITGGIVIGPGLPQVSVETEMLREYYDLTRTQGFEFAYLYPGMSRVIQSAGRVIRSPKHHGIIVLIGEQFTQSPYKDLFPKDWYDRDQGELIATNWVQAITEFWSSKGKS